MQEELRSRIEILANGESSKILSELKKEGANVKKLIKDHTSKSPNLTQTSRNITFEINMTITAAEKNGGPLERLMKRIQLIESKSTIRRYMQLSKDVEKVTSPREYGSLNRELQHLKAQNSKDLSDLTSMRQQAFVHRIKMIECWKAILASEIKVLKEIKDVLSQKVMSKAKESNDEKVLEFIQNKLKELEANPSNLEMSKLGKTDLFKSNVDTLRRMILGQLNEVVQLGKTLIEKRHAYDTLQNVVTEMKSELPEESLRELGEAPAKPTIPQKSTSKLPDPQKVEKKSAARMVYTNNKE